MRIQTVEAKSLITKSKLPDADFVINPYIGCNHGCVYCYAEFMSRFTGHTGEPWGSFIDIKSCNNPFPPAEKLAGKTVLIGSATDPYNPLEKRYKKTQEALLALMKTEARVEILTKSPLVTRDIIIFANMKNISVGISLSTMDENFARLTEKNAHPPKQRLDAMRALCEAGIDVYCFVSPIFPLFQDWKQVAKEAAKYATKICFENLNLRGGYKQRVLELIAAHYPEKSAGFAEIFKKKANATAYWANLETEIRKYMGQKPYKLYFYHEKIKKV